MGSPVPAVAQQAPGGSPPAGGQQAPFGSSPAVGPTANKGFEAAAAQRLGLVIRQLEALVPMIGVTSDIGKAVMKSLNDLAKYVPTGSVSPAVEKRNIEEMSMRNTQANQQMQALKQMGGGQGGGPGAPPGMGAAA